MTKEFPSRAILYVLLILVALSSLALLTYLYSLRESKIRLLLQTKVCLSCHKDLKKELKLAAVHKPFKEGKCLDCHTKHYPPKRKSKLKAPQKKLCTTCHKKTSKDFLKSNVHRPFIKGDCGNCHKPHASKFAGLLKNAPSELCVSCHPIANQLTQSNVHEPFKKRRCLDCHHPHASDERGILLSYQGILCLTCHQDIAKTKNLPLKHSPVEVGKCTDCHRAHASSQSPLLSQEEPSLCHQCHPKIRASGVSRHPIGSRLKCTSCHKEIHASLYPHLLMAQGNDLCYICHADKRVFYVSNFHHKINRGRGEGSCLNCHDVIHASNFASLLSVEPVSLCTSCHSTGDIDRNHPLGGQYTDSRVNKELTCSSTCHDPHGTVNVAMLRLTGDNLCITCHPQSELP